MVAQAIPIKHCFIGVFKLFLLTLIYLHFKASLSLYIIMQ